MAIGHLNDLDNLTSKKKKNRVTDDDMFETIIPAWKGKCTPIFFSCLNV